MELTVLELPLVLVFVRIFQISEAVELVVFDLALINSLIFQKPMTLTILLLSYELTHVNLAGGLSVKTPEPMVKRVFKLSLISIPISHQQRAFSTEHVLFKMPVVHLSIILKLFSKTFSNIPPIDHTPILRSIFELFSPEILFQVFILLKNKLAHFGPIRDVLQL